MTTATSAADALAERLSGATLGALELFSVQLGAELGLYGSLAQRGQQTAGELAGSAGIAPRYAREWLQEQAVADLLRRPGPRRPGPVLAQRRPPTRAHGCRRRGRTHDVRLEHAEPAASTAPGHARRGLRRKAFDSSCGDSASRVQIAADGVEFLASPRRDGSQSDNGETPDGATSAPRNDHGGDLSWPLT
jgi:hypothetical protein